MLSDLLLTVVFATAADLAGRHNLYRETLFHAKSSLHALLRALHNLIVARVRRWPRRAAQSSAPIIGSSDSALWYADDNEKNWILTAGKIENLRVAVRALHGIEVPAGHVFSFWRHVGRPGRSRGYVIGREIREGCLVPTIAGGLCQLSNALYDAALSAGFTIVERHRHSRVVSGSLAERDRDATVKWNYVDLRFVSAQSFRLEVEITNDRLLVRLRGREPHGQAAAPTLAPRLVTTLNDCYSCGNVSCHRHQGEKVLPRASGTTAFLVDERWPEYEAFIQTQAQPGDLLVMPFGQGRPVGTKRYAWQIPPGCFSHDVPLPSAHRALALRVHRGGHGSLPALLLRFDERIAAAMVRRIPVACTHVVIAQNLLPFVWRSGALGGRTFDVLMTRLPMERLHERLDRLHALRPSSRTAADYRAPQTLVDLENAALTRARRIITPHVEVASVFNNKSVLLPWMMPATRAHAEGPKILFPGSAVGRKGAFEMRDAARSLDLGLVILGRDIEEDGFWHGLKTERAGSDPFTGVQMVVLPGYVEHQPRVLLRALAAGIPVITTAASGLGERPGVTLIPMGDVTALVNAIRDGRFTPHGSSSS